MLVVRRGLRETVRAGLTAVSAASLQPELDRIQDQIGALHARAVRQLGEVDIREAEFRIFSQFGEDGIIQYLISKVPIENEVFVEFGVADYRESNTRFLLVNDNWRGLILDGGTAHIDFLASTDLGWRHHIDARSAFVTRENINELISEAGLSGDIGLLSVDIDGNDYWVLEAIGTVSPRILITEYNSLFGPEAAVTIPYDPAFLRAQAHYSHLYWGASLAAFASLAGTRGYALVGGNSAGNNAFFVREDVLGNLKPVPVAEAYAASLFRESRDPSGELSYLAGVHERLQLLRNLRVWDVESGREVTVAERYELD